ncbi:DNA polymerase III subunit alpha [Oecophyllibacter saccharovorans]|uniref:DNA polymerase III subunit alpha n=1 Tax=Oecophyllibacter saccharovorans TaxID=2558360 RepID=A0A506UQV9_9PROT|nr:DNA polymerase III subunit alpha [Oecophyllibacter saccharovorans]TPW35751.1 DNA polymerase III subunit alpha [Oecophyllibacter saccharovorans]
MSHADFVHLRNHSAYSLSQGAMRVPDLVRLAVENAMPAVALADSGNLFGALEFSQTCRKSGVQPIIGCQLALPSLSKKVGAPADPLVVLARNEEGLQNLRFLTTQGYLGDDPADPRVSLDVLCEKSAGLFLLTGGNRSRLNHLLLTDQEEQAQHFLEQLKEAFGDNLAVELNRLGEAGEAVTEERLIALADKLALPLVATNECFFAVPDMHEAHDALLCIAQGRTMAEEDRWRVSPEAWFKPAVQMRSLFGDLPEACDNTLTIARMCAVATDTRKPLLPVCSKVREGSTEAETLRAMAREGLEKRLAVMPDGEQKRTQYEQRLTHELDIIEGMGFPGYFLIVADFIQWTKAHDIPVGPGRGSGAGSLVAYALTITDIDPIPFGLLFERFLNPERVSMPDFDIDFCQDRRDEVIRYVRNEYGQDRVAQIITFGKLQAKAAVRDVGRVMGLPYGLVNKVAELIPNNPAKPTPLAVAIASEPRLQEMRDTDEAVRDLLGIALKLEGLFRHASTHAAGVVIGDRKLVELVPLYRDPRSDMLVTQFNMKFVEQAGLVKFDFLGLTTLTILKRGVDFLEEMGIRINLSRIPLDDPATFAMLARGDTAGVFQFEGAGMRDMLRQMEASRLEDLIAGVSLYRPGPMAHIPEYCRRKHGAHWEAPHEEIRPILEETYGIMVYQEQVMQIAQKMAGYSLGAADLLRRAMGKKIASEMEKQRAIFREGAMKRGITAEKAEEVFDLMAKFADYGFNKSHAAAYALVSYQTAWLKANHPEAFLAGCMSLAREKTDKLAALCQEADRMGIEVLPVDINRSQADFSIETLPDGRKAIRYALSAVKRVGTAAMEGLVADRAGKAFIDLTDFAERVDAKHINKIQLESLAKAGAFDSLGLDRHTVFANAELVLRRAQTRAQEKEVGQGGLFGGSAGAPMREVLRLKKVQPWPDFERLSQEANVIGFHMSAHPLDAYRKVLQRLGVKPAARLEELARQGVSKVKIAGCVVDKKERPTRTGKKMAWVGLSDPSGNCEVTLFAETLGVCRDLLVTGQAVVVTAELKLEGDALRITVQGMIDLERAAAEDGGEIRLWVEREEVLPQLKAVLEQVEGGRGRIYLLPAVEEARAVEIMLPARYRVTPRLSETLQVLEGLRLEES